jgi:tRNA U34 5-methylaminomethyl-2-thiouridine-forming methyltransferase MnmC
MLTLVETADGSKTLFNSEVGEHYHSKHGALQESRHVFLKSGLEFYLSRTNAPEVSILEVGFGTGLNFLVTAEFCTNNQIQLDYTGIEAYPLDDLISKTGYQEYVSKSLWTSFLSNYPAGLSQEVSVNEYCRLLIAAKKLLDFRGQKKYDVLYFDAFASVHQPEMWDLEPLHHAAGLLKPGGVFVTYAITGHLKRAMKSLGFTIEKVPGAPGKREMLRALKLGL